MQVSARTPGAAKRTGGITMRSNVEPPTVYNRAPRSRARPWLRTSPLDVISG
jgi:hypothetical protein